MKTPDEINMNSENAFLLREAAKAHDMGYCDHLANGGKGDPAEERWIDALSAGADALERIRQLETFCLQLKRENKDLLEERELNDYLRDKVKQLERERDALWEYVHDRKDCASCKHGHLLPKCEEFDYFCEECDIERPCPCEPCGDEELFKCNWEWRGVKEDEKE